MSAQFEIKHVKFADGIKGIEVSLDKHSIAYSYCDSVDKHNKIEQAKSELYNDLFKRTS